MKIKGFQIGNSFLFVRCLQSYVFFVVWQHVPNKKMLINLLLLLFFACGRLILVFQGSLYASLWHLISKAVSVLSLCC